MLIWTMVEAPLFLKIHMNKTFIMWDSLAIYRFYITEFTLSELEFADLSESILIYPLWSDVVFENCKNIKFDSHTFCD
jgi:hypothetical protein